MRCALPTALSILALLPIAAPAVAQVPPAPGKPVTIDATLSGQPIRAAEGPLRVTITQTVIAAGGRLPSTSTPTRGS